MELKVDAPALAGQNVDPAAFQRVWDRVMPGQAVRTENGVPDTAVPAEPTVPPAEQPGTPELPPVPVCEAEPSPELPSVPDCLARPECPACPDCPECPSCPECPGQTPAPEAPDFCLGEASQGDSGQLESLMTLAQEGALAGRMLVRRASGGCARALAALAFDHRQAFRRLSAAYFLITGRRYSPKCAVPDLPASLPLALRQQFVWEQQWERRNRQAARDTADPCLRELYLELAQEGALHAGTIRSLLEQMG